MELNNIPEAFQTRLRVAILSALVTGSKSFREIKQITDASDGNISVQIGRLEEMGYVSSTKEFICRKPCTTYKLTEKGLAGFTEYVTMLKTLLPPAHS